MDHHTAAGPPRADHLTRTAPIAPSDLAAGAVAAALARGSLVLCTDYDGTIAPIAATPGTAQAIGRAVEALTWLSRTGAERGLGALVPVRVAAITSRSTADLAARLRLGDEALIIGSSGLERWHAGHVEIDPGVVPWLPAIDAATGRLATALGNGRVPGARLERKQCGVVLHTRGLSRPGAEEEALALATEVGAEQGLALVTGKRAVELRPPVDRDKGDAVRELLDGRFAGAALLVAGDDLPDVPMLEVAAARGGIGVAVADAETPEAVIDAATAWVDAPWGWAEALAAISVLLRR